MATSSLEQGAIYCVRAASDGWYARPADNLLWAIGLVPVFSLVICLSNLQPIKSRILPVQVSIACAGWVVNKFGTIYIYNRTDIVSGLASFTIGILANIWARLFRESAFLLSVPGILAMVPVRFTWS